MMTLTLWKCHSLFIGQVGLMMRSQECTIQGLSLKCTFLVILVNSDFRSFIHCKYGKRIAGKQ